MRPGCFEVAVLVALVTGAAAQLDVDDVCPITAIQGASVDVDGDDFAMGEGGHSASGCYVYPIDVSTYKCKGWLGGRSHYMPDPNGTAQELIDLQATEDAIAQRLALLESASGQVSEDCFYNFLAYSCLLRYPSCVDDNGIMVPQKFAVSVYDYLFSPEGCQVLVLGSQAFGIKVLASLPGDPITLAEPQYFFLPDDWLGTPSFENPGLEFEDMEANYSLPGKVALLDSGNAAFNCLPPQSLVDDRVEGQTTCEFDCKFPLYSDQEWTRMWTALVVPGLASIPLNCMALWRATYSLRHAATALSAAKQGINWLFIFTLLAAILYAGLSAVPATLFGNQVGCVSLSSGITIDDSTVCNVTKSAVFVLQSFLLCVTATLYKIYVRTRAAKRMKLYESSNGERIAIISVCFFLPALLCTIAFAVEDLRRNEEEILFLFQFQYLLRNGFTCVHRFDSAVVELLLIHVPLLLTGVVGFVLALGIAFTLTDASMSTFCSLIIGSYQVHSSAFDIEEERGSSSESSSRGGGGSFRKKAKKLLHSGSSRGKGKRRAAGGDMTGRISSQMLRFAAVMALFLMIGFAAVISFFPKLDSFNSSFGLWVDCLKNGGLFTCFASGDSFASGIQSIANTCCQRCQLGGFAVNNTDICGACDDAPTTEQLFGADRTEFDIPSVETFTMYYLSQSLLPFFFGLLFAWGEITNLCATIKHRAMKDSRSGRATTTNKSGSSLVPAGRDSFVAASAVAPAVPRESIVETFEFPSPGMPRGDEPVAPPDDFDL